MLLGTVLVILAGVFGYRWLASVSVAPVTGSQPPVEPPGRGAA